MSLRRLGRDMNHDPGDGDHDAGGCADAPLHEALDDLEHMLEPGGIPVAGQAATPADRAALPASRLRETTASEVPPEETLEAPHRPASPVGPVGTEAWDTALYRMSAERLASELEIIMNARLESALVRLGEDLRRDLRNHIEIVLPEIVATLADDDLPPR